MATPQKRLNPRNVTFFSSTLLGALILVPIYIWNNGLPWPLVALTLVLYVLTTWSITGGYHRLFSHRAYEAHPLLKFIYLFFGTAAFQGSALEWCADHRIHHRHTDTEKDPYNIKQGFWWAHIGWIFYEPGGRNLEDFPEDLKKEPLFVFQFKHYGILAVICGFGMPTVIGALMGYPFGGFLFGGVLRMVLASQSTFLINSYAHTFGRRPYNNRQTARDSFILGVLAMGEGYHNYHHQFASDYRNGVRWYQWDPTKWSIRFFSWIGLTWRLKTIPKVEIIRARVRNEEATLLARGIPREKVQALKEQVEASMSRMKLMRESYIEFKRSVRSNIEEYSKYKKKLLKAEVRVANVQFRAALAAWSLYAHVWSHKPF